MMKAYLRAGRNVTSEVLAPAHAALDAADRSGIIAAWLFFESITVTKAAEPNIMSLGSRGVALSSAPLKSYPA